MSCASLSVSSFTCPMQQFEFLLRVVRGAEKHFILTKITYINSKIFTIYIGFVLRKLLVLQVIHTIELNKEKQENETKVAVLSHPWQGFSGMV